MLAKSVSAVVLIGLASAGYANDILGRPEYAPLNLARAVGYHDHARKDGTWSIEASSSAREREGYASEMAIYRAAEIAKEQGHRFLQVLRTEGTVGTGMMNRGNENVALIVRFADTNVPPADCLQRGRSPAGCYTVDGEKILGRLVSRISNARQNQDRLDQYPGPAPQDSGLVRWSTVFRFDVTEHGGIENCVLTETDAPAALNESACRTFTTMAHFKPASDAAGQPVRQTRTVRVIWQRPEFGRTTTMIPLKEKPVAAGTPLAVIAATQPTPAPAAPLAQPAPAKPAAPIRTALATKPKRGPVNDTVEVPFDQ